MVHFTDENFVSYADFDFGSKFQPEDYAKVEPVNREKKTIARFYGNPERTPSNDQHINFIDGEPTSNFLLDL